MWNPLGQAALNNTPAWRPEPYERGTFNILSTCLLTLSFCAWSTLHLNIPDERDSEMQKFRRKIKWQLAASLEDSSPSPGVERSLWRRVLEFLRVRKGSQIAQDDTELGSLPQTSGSASAQRRHQWTIKHTHYALMGGFVFDLSQRSSCSTTIRLPDGRQHLTLTPSAVIFLAENHHKLLPDVSEAFILDKGKTTCLTKSIILGQALWFCCQCISRLVQGLPVTLLELNTIAHVLYAFFTYFIWWDKPLDISEPTEIRVSDLEVKQLCAAMCVRSSLFSRKRCDGHRRSGFLKPYTDQTLNDTIIMASDAEMPVASLPNDGEMQDLRVPVNRGTSMATTLNNESSPQSTGQDCRLDIDAPPRDAQCRPQDSTGPFQIALGETKKGISFDRTLGMMAPEHIPQGYFTLTVRQRLSRRAIDLSPPVITVDEGTQALFSLASGYQNPSAIERQQKTAQSQGFVNLRSKDLDWSDFWGSEKGKNTFMTFLYAGCIYGGLHLIAWNGPFRTHTEVLLWRIAAVTITGPLALLGIGVGLFLVLFPFMLAYILTCLITFLCFRGAAGILAQWRIESFLELGDITKTAAWSKLQTDSWLKKVIVAVTVLVYLAALLLYGLSRLFIVVECFISLAFAPTDTFRLPNWSVYFPHVG
ncbi:uncharacterized protein NECHADRAFT_87751 [Fusarium vanettenii 77-13-4]|uniref:Uncharacterized protein n=1 Tax=Fusarium vanettenii (strain ATCC MYA-4622 / CBS 123669 / FGSC 9596 / NRRL 45880 / 77-13-4) TaxID=660122 RepID=C7Z2X6_FUSV7|nr:uncharacterized protein NECHADRAFT_87751 [Fusarium vanettenii 77-13-4]EEU41559.1 hypothetical protein NECHADRAFT_87751 [Fusarium vanettenii 77-13-4]